MATAKRKPRAAALAESATSKRGRPPGEPRTTLARWIQARDMRVTELARLLAEAAPKLGLSADLAPPAKTLLDAVNGRHRPNLPVVLLIKHVTNGEVDVEHWVRDLYE